MRASFRLSELRISSYPSISEICSRLNVFCCEFGARGNHEEARWKSARLKLKVAEDLDEGLLEARDGEAVPDATDEPDWVNLDADVLQEATDEARPVLRVLEQVLPQFLVPLLLRKLNGLR